MFKRRPTKEIQENEQQAKGCLKKKVEENIKKNEQKNLCKEKREKMKAKTEKA